MNIFHRTALIIVDVQNDFCEGGALAVNGGNSAAEAIASHLLAHRDDYTLIVASRDWHKPDTTNGGHFHSEGAEPDYVNTWPDHCVQGTPGAEYHPAIKNIDNMIDAHIVKGMGVAAYSAFEGSVKPYEGQPHGWVNLSSLLSGNNITDIHIVGIATDHCVKATALDAIAKNDGRQTVTVLLDLCAGVTAETTLTAIEDMLSAGVRINVAHEQKS